MGWILICFDLPVEPKEFRKATTRFRKDLLDMGCMMLQNSVYVRNCVSFEKMDGFVERIRKFSPLTGRINIMVLTNKQWEKMVTLELTGYCKSRRATKSDTYQPVQMPLW